MTEPASNWSKPKPNSVSTQTGGQLSVRGLAQFLNDLGKSLQRPTNGPVLGEALVRLSNTLRQHQDKELDEVLEILAGGTAPQKKPRCQMSKPLEGVDLQALGTNQVEALLSNEKLSKQDLIEVGTMRLGISKSRLARQSKQAVLETVTSALQNEEAYHIISREAGKEGLRRARVQRLV
jgi:hypothetical protein